MKQLLLISLSALLVSCGGGDKQATDTASPAKVADGTQQEVKQSWQSEHDKAALIEQAKLAVQALGGTLKGELQSAMKSGGPVNAMDVCNTKAPEIAKSVSADKNMAVSRVSLQNRNPVMGKANDWQDTVLNEFETRKASGEKPDTLAYANIVKTSDGHEEFRFMKAIPTGSLCLTCHGSELKPEVSAKLNELYPDDKATGFKEGDLRGAFVVVKQLAE
ncbi:Tll0287-like domain-containing protein [Leucothrix pacifica]|uniref:Glutamate synthase n=1 Tax=Leucothrix pacifica TaxID=1247513 RepID=A0A317CDZ7_9GAMM|nr:DUF3365 domain-containing protein [Leucothrix pacifica]PWQ96599.1 glutamate synthase [Leucothrix pacifica]